MIFFFFKKTLLSLVLAGIYTNLNAMDGIDVMNDNPPSPTAPGLPQVSSPFSQTAPYAESEFRQNLSAYAQQKANEQEIERKQAAERAQLEANSKLLKGASDFQSKLKKGWDPHPSSLAHSPQLSSPIVSSPVVSSPVVSSPAAVQQAASNNDFSHFNINKPQAIIGGSTIVGGGIGFAMGYKPLTSLVIKKVSELESFKKMPSSRKATLTKIVIPVICTTVSMGIGAVLGLLISRKIV